MSETMIFEQKLFPATNSTIVDIPLTCVDPSPWDTTTNEKSNSDLAFDYEEGLEPTPIGYENIKIVEQSRIPLLAATWLEEGYWSSFLTLLQEPKVQGGAPSLTTTTTDDDDGDDSSCSKNCSDESNFKASQLVQWTARFEDLVAFRNKYNHCLVPLTWPENPGLAHWIKRQRYQYSLKQEGKHSTLSPDREEALSKLGFTWDSHAAQWEERLKELEEFRDTHGHCYVPTKYPENPKLSIWVKCQRRQYKLFQTGSRSNMTAERISRLLRVGFVFYPRVAKRSLSISSTMSNGRGGGGSGSGGMEYSCL
jgi:Helicase associated domain